MVPLNVHFKWFLRIVAIKLIHHIEKCAGTLVPSKTASTIMWKRVLVPRHSQGWQSHINAITSPVEPMNMLSKGSNESLPKY